MALDDEAQLTVCVPVCRTGQGLRVEGSVAVSLAPRLLTLSLNYTSV